MVITVHSPAGDSVQLADEAFAQGGEAAVHSVPSYPNVVVKLYHPHILQKRAATLRAKVEAMTTDPQLATFKRHTELAWPHFSVFDEKKQWRGYAMRRAAGVRMTVLAHAMAYREHFPQLNRQILVSYLCNLLDTLQKLHASGVMIGDYNPANFLCDPQSGAVTLIDCDSWQVTTQGGITFRCPVAAPDMLAPELQGKELSTVSRSLESELFAVAILLFKVLMLGRHPFDVVGGESPVENIRKGYFPYGPGGGGIPKGPWFNIWSHLPFKLKELLVKTFKEGTANPAERATLAQWQERLAVYQNEMEKGWHDTGIKPQAPKSKDYRGQQSISQPMVA